MGRYQIWNKEDNLYPPAVGSDGKGAYTPEEYIATHAPWAANPNAKVIITTGAINCGAFMEFEATKQYVKQQVLWRMENDEEYPSAYHWDDNWTDQEVLDVMEWLESNQPVVATPVSAEERIAAALEFQNVLSL